MQLGHLPCTRCSHRQCGFSTAIVQRHSANLLQSVPLLQAYLILKWCPALFFRPSFYPHHQLKLLHAIALYRHSEQDIIILEKELDDKFFEFDNTYPVQRIRLIIAEIKGIDLPKQIATEIDNLFGFRNEVMHSDPLYRTDDFKKIIKLKVDKKANKTVEKDPSRFKYYPDLTVQNRPLSLSHSLLATATHDKLVDHIISTAESVDIMDFLNEIDMTNIDKGLLWGDPTFTLNYKKASLIAEEMNAMNKELNKVAMRDQLLFLKKLHLAACRDNY